MCGTNVIKLIYWQYKERQQWACANCLLQSVCGAQCCQGWENGRCRCTLPFSHVIDQELCKFSVKMLKLYRKQICRSVKYFSFFKDRGRSSAVVLTAQCSRACTAPVSSNKNQHSRGKSRIIALKKKALVYFLCWHQHWSISSCDNLSIDSPFNDKGPFVLSQDGFSLWHNYEWINILPI